MNVILTFSHLVEGYFNVHAIEDRGAECLRSAACLLLALPDGASVSLTVVGKPADIASWIVWTTTVTPETREACRVLLRDELGELRARRRAA